MNKKLKGFTLIELIVVIAIIGVLTLVLVPSYMNWIAMSKVRKQNNNARVIFNAAQTIVQEYKFKERKLEDANKNIGDKTFVFYWDKDSGGSASGNASKASDSAFVSDFAQQINKMYGDSGETTYKIKVQNYMVKSVVASSGNTNRHKGSYPIKQDDPTSVSVYDFEMDAIALPST